MRSAALDDPLVFRFQSLECLDDLVHGGEELILYRHDRGDVHRGGESVVGALALIDVVVGMLYFFPRQLVAPIGDDFVGVHVRLRAAARLPDDERKACVISRGITSVPI